MVITKLRVITVADVEPLAAHHFLHQPDGLQHFNLIVEIVGQRHHAQILHVAQSLYPPVPVALLDKHGGTHIVNRCLVAEVEPRPRHASHHEQKNERPMDEVFENERLDVNHAVFPGGVGLCGFFHGCFF